MISLKGKHLLVGTALTAVATLAMAGSAFAQDAEPTVTEVSDAVTSLGTATNLLWVIIGAALVIFMQAGFALVETGFCRAKHAAHVVSTNFAIFGLGFVGFLFVGFPLAFGGFSYSAFGLDTAMSVNSDGTSDALIGSGNWKFLFHGWDHLGSGATPALLGFFLYMVAFMDTTATIPTGSMAERWKWNSFVVWGLFCGAIYYPLFAAWTWGGGWLSQLGNSGKLGLGYVDFAGSGVVHAAGGVAALAGSLVLGPRIGKFGKDGKPRALPGHHIPMAMLGTFILLFGWFGFNAASTFAATDVQFATVAANTGIAAALGGTIGMFWITVRTGKPDPGMMVNGMLAGLVAITAPCAFVSPWAAALIGAIAAVLCIEAVFIIERKFKIDDPVGAIAVHGVNGLFGVLAVGIFSNGNYGAGWNGTTNGKAATSGKGVTGIFYDFSIGGGQLAAQAIGVLVLVTVIFGVAFAFFKIQDTLTKGGIRSKEEDEIVGLDIPEMGVQAYPEFSGALGGVSSSSD
ncbi:MAG: ammonium transporter [Acidimicrobiia bacterium]